MLKTVAITAGGGTNGTVTNVATGTGLTGGPITTTGTISLANTSVTAGTYGGANTVATVTVNNQGQLTNATNVSIEIDVAAVSGAVPNTVNVLSGGLLSGGGPLTGNVTISLTSVPAANVSGLGTMSTQNANAVSITGGNISVPNVTVTSNLYANLSTSSTATFTTSSLPLVPEGYLSIIINGVAKKIPYYGV